MDWSLHELTPELEPQFREVVAWAYGGEPPTDDPVPSFEGLGRRYVGLIGGEGAAVCQVFDFSATREDADFSLGGIGLVGVHPNHRRGGIGQQLMREVLHRSAEAGHVMASLYAFRDPFYRKVGFATCGWVWEIKCPVDRMPKTEASLPIRQLPEGDWSAIASVHDQWIRPRTLGVHRSAELWQRRLSQSPAGRYVFGDPAEGYAIVKHGGFWGTIEVSEFVYTSKAAYETGMALFRSLAINNNEIQWLEPADSPFLAEHWDHGVQARREKGSMVRVIDVAGALRSLRPAPDVYVELTVSVIDPLFDSAKGPWFVRAENGEVEVSRTDDSPDICIGIEEFSQGYAGDPSWAWLARYGSLSGSPSSLAALSKLMPAMTVYHSEAY